MQFFDTPGDVRNRPDLLGYVPVVERAWESLGLEGVLFAHGRPTVYLKESLRPFKPVERIRLHRQFWNQGVANVLVLADPERVYIYSALARPVQDDATEERALVETLEHAAYAQHTQQFLASIDSGAYYQEFKNCFQPHETVDAYLLDNLLVLRDELCDNTPKLPVDMAHAFLGRLLFACYLLDREIVSLNDGKTDPHLKGAARLEAILERSRTFPQQREFLYGWFAELKTQFNGTMFDQDLEAERSALRADHVDAVIHFLGGHDMPGRQRTLGFWAYDFRMIPVETISAIYESFLAKEDKEAKRQGGAFYTPRFLAEMVMDIATEGVPDIAAKRCLDPACGSGIFLVTLFSRMASSWLNQQSGQTTYAARVRAFQRILREQIRGIDVNETACRIACFSLYLAYLDRLAPPDIREHARKTGRALPRLLAGSAQDTVPSEDLIPVVRCTDALENTGDLNGTFDVVIGNPPWKERPERLAQRFAERVPDFLRSGGTGCLLLPTALLLNRTDDFQARWLRRITLERIVNLADYRLLLFTAKRPALIARFRNESPSAASAVVAHDAPKFRRDTLREGCVTIGPADRSWIPLRNILAAAHHKSAPIIWKRHLWGTPRDQKLLDIMLDMPTLGDIAGEPREKKRWIKGQGFQPNTSGKSETPSEAWWHPSASYLSARAAAWQYGGLFLLERDCEPVGNRFHSLHRPRDPRIYVPPMVLVSKGFEKVAFCDFPVLFQHAIQSIAAPSHDEELLTFLAAYLRSPLARYFLFHTAGNWGTERDEVHLDELLCLPFPLPGNEYASAKAERIVSEVEQAMRALRAELDGYPVPSGRTPRNRDLLQTENRPSNAERKRLTDALQSQLNERVYAYFGLTPQEIMVIEDTVQISIPSSTPGDWWKTEGVYTLDPVQSPCPAAYRDGIAVYAETLANTLNGWAAEEQSAHRVVASGGVDKQSGLGLVTLELTERESGFRSVDVSATIWKALSGYRRRALRRRHGTFAHERDVFLYQGKKVHIVRPAILANWTRTAAINDAANLYAEIGTAREARA